LVYTHNKLKTFRCGNKVFLKVNKVAHEVCINTARTFKDIDTTKEPNWYGSDR